MKNQTIFIIGVLLAVLIILVIVLRLSTPEDTWLCQDGVWVQHGSPSAPQPTTGCGTPTIFEPIAPEPQTPQPFVYKDLVKLETPLPNDYISSPLTIRGEARGTWFFEASFPIVLVNWDGLIIAQGIAQAQSDWMTEDFVPFEATLTFTKPDYKNNGALILKKDNPSGLPQNDDALEIPIFFN